MRTEESDCIQGNTRNMKDRERGEREILFTSYHIYRILYRMSPCMQVSSVEYVEKVYAEKQLIIDNTRRRRLSQHKYVSTGVHSVLY